MGGGGGDEGVDLLKKEMERSNKTRCRGINHRVDRTRVEANINSVLKNSCELRLFLYFVVIDNAVDDPAHAHVGEHKSLLPAEPV